MIAIEHFDASFAACLPETYSILRLAGLVVHPAVAQITLHGSRGLAQNYRPDSDLDLSLLLSFPNPPTIDEGLEKLLREVIAVTLSNWRGLVELDLAAIFPLFPCNYACFQRPSYNPEIFATGGRDCFGVYKTQKGFSGFVLNAGLQVERIYPCITVWKKAG